MGTGAISKTVLALTIYVHHGTSVSPQFVPVFPIVSVSMVHASVQLITVATEARVLLSAIKMEMLVSSATVPMGFLAISVMMSAGPILAQMVRYAFFIIKHHKNLENVKIIEKSDFMPFLTFSTHTSQLKVKTKLNDLNFDTISVTC